MSGPGRTATAGRAWRGRPRPQQERHERCRQDGNSRTGMTGMPAKQQHQDSRMSGCARSDHRTNIKYRRVLGVDINVLLIFSMLILLLTKIGSDCIILY